MVRPLVWARGRRPKKETKSLPAYLRKLLEMVPKLWQRRKFEKACQITGHELFAKTVGVPVEEMLRVSFPNLHYISTRSFGWPSKTPCLLIGAFWKSPDELTGGPSPRYTTRAHWVFYQNGVLTHSCSLAEDISLAGDRLEFPTTREELAESEIRSFEELLRAEQHVVLNQASYVWGSYDREICQIIARYLRNKPGFDKLEPNALETMRISSVHRTFIEAT